MRVLSRLASPVRRLLPTNAFARGVGVLVGGTAGAQLLMLLAAPVLTRLYGPDDFGLLAVFTACLALFTVVAAGRYELAIPLPEADHEAACLALLGMVCVLLTAGLALLAVLLWSAPLAALLGAPGLVDYLWLLPVGVAFVGSYQVFNKWAVRTQRFSHVARTRIWQALGTLGIQVGASGLGPVALLGGQAVGQGVGTTGLTLAALRHPAFRRVSLAGMARQAWRHRRFPLYSTWTGLFNTGSLQLAPIVLVALFGAPVAGLYALTLRILTMPVSLVGNAIGSVFLAHAAQARRDGELAGLVGGLHRKLAILGIPPLVALMVVGPELFAVLFGEQWRKAGLYAQWMLPWIYIQFQWSPLSMLASVLELQRDALVAQLGMLVARFGVLVGLYLAGAGADTAILAFSVTSALVYLLQQGWFFRKAGLSLWRCAAEELGHLLMFIVLSLPLVLPYLQEALPLAGLLAALAPLAVAWTWWRLRPGRGGKHS
ncbi:lipopolysaccharide biosynthesis protein [Halomonas nitroreducens]|uniref:Lipopolysaccharide biosynthesis protein n=1 Tax=Halomonas nitroreducens TaxID=447425 RepID=A0A431V4A2_9GAMM|nr:lipopolysaccharide biosynthesis protein [Halomonas nitroreducens]